MAGVEARAGRREVELWMEIVEAAGDGAPFVGVAHQHRRHLVRTLRDGLEDRAHLPPPPQARKVEMHANHPNWLLVDEQLRDHRSARLKRWQLQGRAVEHAHM